jgi:hypothetical protein
MTFKPPRLLIAAATLAASVVLALPVSAEPAKPLKPKPQAKTTTTIPPVQSAYRGADKFRTGPLYNGPDYLGDDPDPFIRSQIQRDLTARYPGGE